MLDHVLGDLLRVEEAGGDVEVLRRSLAPIKTIAKDAAIVTRAAEQSGVPAELFASARSWVRATVFLLCSRATECFCFLPYEPTLPKRFSVVINFAFLLFLKLYFLLVAPLFRLFCR